ncbi:ATP-binding protein [Sphingomonas sp. DT-207]|uniref:ATP-binding protein n=1 Tax=Sphingomonas sp. DT-207 TaxID=3396167 RepID=UPI003F54026E
MASCASSSGADAVKDAAHLEQALGALALRLRREVEVMRALRASGRREQFLGLVLGEEDAAMLCDEIAGRIGIGREDGLDAEVGRAERAVHEARASDPELMINRLARCFGLDPLAQDLLILAAAPAIDPRFGLIYGFLADDMARRSLTPSLAQRILADRGVGLLALRAACASDGPLRRHALLSPEDGDRPLMANGLHCEERLLDLLMGRERSDPALAPWIAFDTANDAIAEAYPAAQAPLENCIALVEASDGDAGLWALALAQRAGAGVARLDWLRWQAVPETAVKVRLARALREARLAGAVPLLHGWDKAPASVRVAAAALLAPPCILTGSGEIWNQAGLAVIGREARAVPVAARTAAWSLAIERGGPIADERLAHALAETFALRFEEMPALVRQAMSGEEPFDHALCAAARRRAGHALADLAERIETSRGFEALVLPPQPMAALSNLVESRVTGPRVVGEWGLGAAYGRRPGLVALFVGPPGTGKTMAAGAVAHMLGIDVYRIDLSGVVSKYIGETERNLELVFQAAERATAVLFFDEADSLFGKRSEVQDAHDRYANIEVSYLLQRIERFDGIAILATNLRQNLDEAFLRRIDFVVDFPVPGPAERLHLWSKLAGTGAPLADGVDFALLAERYELTGGAIRNCAIAAAHAAARDDQPIAMRHLVAAVAREYLKQGQPLRKALFADLHALPGGGKAVG